MKKLAMLLMLPIACAFNKTEFKMRLLNYHNYLRWIHDAPPVTIDPSLDWSAYNWAVHLSNFPSVSCLYHSREGGENIYFQWAPKPISELDLARAAAKAFYEEIKYYNYNQPGLVVPAAHFTNLVWKAVERMGIAVYIKEYTDSHGGCRISATRSSPQLGYMVVVHNYPNSNIKTWQEFSKNVVRPRQAYQFK